MHSGFIRTAALLGAFGVILGAFAAHKLKDKFGTDVISIFETGVRYHMLHVFAIIAVGILFKDYPNKFMRWSGFLFIAGIILFSFSLYGLALAKGFDASGFKWLGPITPLGGACFIAGWLLLFAGCIK